MASPPGYDAIVVGGGHNGLVTAAVLARDGLRTIVVERAERVGGALRTDDLAPGVRAPTLAHTVGRLDAHVARALDLERHGFHPIRPAVRAFAPEPDGPGITLWSDPRRTAAELEARSPHDAGTFARFDRKVRSIASFLAYLHATTPPDLKAPSPADALAGARLGYLARRLGGGPHLREAIRVLPMAVADLVKDEFEDELLRGVIAARGVQYAAMGPWSSGTAMNLFADSAGNDGGAAGQTVFARGGPGALAEALASAARAAGAQIRCGAEAAAITTSDGGVTGVALAGGEELRAPVVACALDPKRALLSLLDPEDVGPTLGWRAGSIRTPGVVAKVNLALSALPAFAGAGEDLERLSGRVVVAPSIDSLERAFDASKYGRVSDAPYLEATIPTIVDPSLAPPGTHVMSVLVQYAPYALADGSWDDAGRADALGDLVLRTLEEVAPGVTGLVTARHVVTPLDLERDHALTGGHPMHAEHALDQFFAWRPLLGHARYRLGGIEGLYLCGAGAHPGGGVTGRPGLNAARTILRSSAARVRARG